MSDDPVEPTQTTEQGAVIPVPTRGRVMGDLAKVAKPLPVLKKKRRGRRDQRAAP